jgi:hypothetical protein
MAHAATQHQFFYFLCFKLLIKKFGILIVFDPSILIPLMLCRKQVVEPGSKQFTPLWLAS